MPNPASNTEDVASTATSNGETLRPVLANCSRLDGGTPFFRSFCFVDMMFLFLKGNLLSFVGHLNSKVIN
jgi:hypothetical protein